ncbi:hypothetical protein R8Z50_15460 [Longispora sp. K20-0274]|uniref:hypothetical protein n=1 Tax=Longispora sp. K20-0274 TaxID=3088255 RepID=UPI00399C0E95
MHSGQRGRVVMRHIGADAELGELLPVDEAVRLLRGALLARAHTALDPAGDDPARQACDAPAWPRPVAPHRQTASPHGPAHAPAGPHPGSTPAARHLGSALAAPHHGSTPAGRFLAAGLRGDGPQATIVFDDLTGAVEGLVLGTGPGDLRAAATSVLAAEHLAPRHPYRLTILGGGGRAYAQLRFLAARQNPAEILAHGPDADTLAARARAELGLTVTAVRDPAAAVRGAQLVVADGFPLDPDWLSPGTHVTALDWHRARPAALLARADRVVTDAPALAHARLATLAGLPTPTSLPTPAGRPTPAPARVPVPARLDDLADLVAGRASGRRSADEVTLLLSCGLPGADLLLAAAALRRAPAPVAPASPRRRSNYRTHRKP